MVVIIKEHPIGDGHPCFIIAEIGVNHNGNIEIAKKLIDAAVTAGADAVKFQTFISEKVVADFANKADYQNKNDTRHKTQLEMLKSLELSAEEFRELKEYCDRAGIIFLSSPFDLESVELLERLGVPAYKIASGEITNIPLLKKIASKKKPIILSTGMSNITEIRKAIKTIYAKGNKKIVILHCTTNYPAPPESLNLRAITTLKREFHVPVGFSDHSEGILAAPLAVCLGASLIEKHFTLDKNMVGPDHKASLEPHEFKEMVAAMRKTEKMLGSGKKEPQEIEKKIIKNIRRAIFAATTIQKGEMLAPDKLITKRPVVGIPAEEFDKIVGKITIKKINEGEPITYRHIKK